jgi:Flp pilus assembly protein TadG
MLVMGLLLISLVALGVVLMPVSPVSAEPMITAHVAGKATGVLPAPCNCNVEVTIAANARGSAASLEGSGTNHASTGATNHFTLTGSTTGSLLYLSGNIVKSNFPPLVGTPVTITANVESGTLTFTLGPIAGGTFEGQTVVFAGSGTVVITGK